MESDSGLTKRFSFSRKFHLRGRKTFDYVFEHGKKVANQNLVMWYVIYPAAMPDYKAPDVRGKPAISQEGLNAEKTIETENKRIGIVITKKLGKSVRRNRIKRIIREAFRLTKSKLRNGTDIIIYPRVGCNLKNLSDAITAIKDLWNRAGIYNENQQD